MKLIVLFALVMAAGLLLSAGCIAKTTKNTVDQSDTADPVSTVTAQSPPILSGSLKVSISGISDPANLSVVLDDEIVGTVNPSTPLNLMVPEGNHTVRVCTGSVCEQENITTRFGKYVAVDFSEQLHRGMATAKPTARILEYFKNGNSIAVNVEFNNPSTKDLLMSVVVSCGYSYIDDRTSIKMGDSVGGMLVENVKAGQRITKGINLNFASGHNYSYDYPVIKELKVA
jgi:hypothetical protein